MFATTNWKELVVERREVCTNFTTASTRAHALFTALKQTLSDEYERFLAVDGFEEAYNGTYNQLVDDACVCIDAAEGVRKRIDVLRGDGKVLRKALERSKEVLANSGGLPTSYDDVIALKNRLRGLTL